MTSENQTRTALTLAAVAMGSMIPTTMQAEVPCIVINEVHYDADPKTERAEFVELFNAGDSGIDLTGWLLEGVGNYTFPAGTSLASGQFLVVAESIPTMRSKFGVVTSHEYAGTLGNEGDRLQLRDAAGSVIDRVDYRPGFPWPTAARGTGASMELLHPALDNDLGGAWRSSSSLPPSGGGPTPGAPNRVVTANSSAAPPAIRQVKHLPAQPSTAQEVTITAKLTDPDGVAAVGLRYQLLEPGSYIRKSDSAYEVTWTQLPMRDDGTGGDELAGDGTYTVTMPAELQRHRRLVRYRISFSDALGNGTEVPYPDDESPNFAYYVYDGVPAWRGARQPGRTSPQNFPAEVMANSLPVYQLIANASDVTNSQYSSGSDGVRMWGTLIYDGTVYDHIQFYNRGEASTYVSGKNKWRFKFNRARDFEARDIYGKRYRTDWKTLNFNSCASPWLSSQRGIAGLNEAVPHRLYQLAGVPSSNTHWVHFRVVDQAAEAPVNQYEGDLWGLYLAIEHPDGRFLEEHNLPDGNTYKIQNGAGDKKNQGPTQRPDTTDWDSFWARSADLNTVRWWQTIFDLDSYFGFRAINRATGNVDLRDQTNYYMYHHPNRRWHVIPWDLDMMYAPVKHIWSGVIRADRCLDHPAIRTEFRNRCRELLDLLFSDIDRHGGQAAQLVEELSQVINPTGLPLTMVDLDEYMWSFHPRTTSSHRGPWYQLSMNETRLASNFLRTISTADHEGFQESIINYMFDTRDGGSFAVNDMMEDGYGFGYLSMEAADNEIPQRPTISYSGGADFPSDGLRFTSSSFSDPQGVSTFAAMQWRVGEISNPDTPGYIAGEPWIYEIESAWDSGQITPFTTEVALPVGALRTGHTYRARLRHQDDTGRWSHWSEPVEFITTLPDISSYLAGLVVSEIMYHPTDPTPTEFAAGFTDDSDFEFIELRNVGAVTLDLTNVRFTKGVDFDFLGSDITELAPGDFVLVVSNRAAIEERYGPGLPIAGEWEPGDNLDNGGEQIKLSFGAGDAIRDFAYDDVAPWPIEPDGTGVSLVLINPVSVPDHEFSSAWRAGGGLHGTPGTDEGSPPFFSEWMEARGATDPLAPFGSSSVSNLLAYAVGADLSAAPTPEGSLPTITIVEDGGTGYPALRYRLRQDTVDVTIVVEVSDDLVLWQSGGAMTKQVASPQDNHDGTVTVTARSLQSLTAKPDQYLRLRVNLAP